MLRKILLVMLILTPFMAQARGQQSVEDYLFGKWQIEGVKSGADKNFHRPRHMRKWEFRHNGILIEELGKSGAKLTWHYRVVGKEIKVRAEHLSFSWRILAMEDKMMLVRHQLGLLKVKRL